MLGSKFSTRDLFGLVAIPLILLATLLADINIELGTAVWLSYLIAVVLTFGLRLIWLPAAVVVVSIALLITGYAIDPRETNAMMAFTNRSLAGVTLLLLGAAGTLMVRNRQRMDAEA